MISETLLRRLIRDMELMDTDTFVKKRLLSYWGKKRLRRLKERHRFVLWHHILTRTQRDESSRRKIIECMLVVFPKSLSATRGVQYCETTVFKLALSKNDIIPEDLLIRMVCTAPITNLLSSSHTSKYLGSHPWAIAVSKQVPNNVLREIHNRSNFSVINRIFYYFCYDIGVNKGKKYVNISNTTALETIRFLLSIDPMLAKRKSEWRQNLPFHSFLNGWLQVVSRDHYCDKSDEHIIIRFEIADLLIDANPLALETPMEPRGYPGYRGKNKIIPLVFACRMASNMRLYDAIDMGVPNVASSIILFILKKYPKGALCKVFSDKDLEAGPSTPLEFIQDKVLAQQVLSKIGDSVETMTALSTLRDNDTGDTILHVLANRETINCAQLEYDEICSAYASEYSSSPPIERITIYNQEFSTTIMYQGLVELLPELTMVKNQNGDLPIHVRLKSKETKGLFEDLFLFTKSYDRAIKEMTAAVHGRTKPNDKEKKLLCQDTHIGMGMPSFVVAAMHPPEKSCLNTIHFLLQRYIEQHGGLQHYTTS